MKRRILAAALLLAMSVAPATASTYLSYRCSNSTVLRVIFDGDSATVVRFGQPDIRLTRADAGDNEFRYVRRNSHELRGSSDEVHWRVGRAEWVCTHGG